MGKGEGEEEMGKLEAQQDVEQPLRQRDEEDRVTCSGRSSQQAVAPFYRGDTLNPH